MFAFRSIASRAKLRKLGGHQKKDDTLPSICFALEILWWIEAVVKGTEGFFQAKNYLRAIINLYGAAKEYCDLMDWRRKVLFLRYR